MTPAEVRAWQATCACCGQPLPEGEVGTRVDVDKYQRGVRELAEQRKQARGR